MQIGGKGKSRAAFNPVWAVAEFGMLATAFIGKAQFADMKQALAKVNLSLLFAKSSARPADGGLV